MEKHEYIGNSKRFTIYSNNIHLRIIGNDNKIDVKKNSGYLDVIGNSTKVKIDVNTGRVNYFGDNGKLYFGSRAATGIRCYGNNGIIKCFSKESHRNATE